MAHETSKPHESVDSRVLPSINTRELARDVLDLPVIEPVQEVRKVSGVPFRKGTTEDETFVRTLTNPDMTSAEDVTSEEVGPWKRRGRWIKKQLGKGVHLVSAGLSNAGKFIQDKWSRRQTKNEGLKARAKENGVTVSVQRKNESADVRAEKRREAIAQGGLKGWVAEQANKVDDAIKTASVWRHGTGIVAGEGIRKLTSLALRIVTGVPAAIMLWSLSYATITSLWAAVVGSAMLPTIGLALAIPLAWIAWEGLQIGKRLKTESDSITGVGNSKKHAETRLKKKGLNNPNRIA